MRIMTSVAKVGTDSFNINMTEQKQFKALTKKLGLSSQEVAESLGLSKSYYLKALQPSSPCPTWVSAVLLIEKAKDNQADKHST